MNVYQVVNKENGDLTVYKADTLKDLHAHIIESSFEVKRATTQDLIKLVGDPSKIIAIPPARNQEASGR